MKRFFQITSVVLLIPTLIACSGIKTFTDYDEHIELNSFDTFSFYEEMDTGMSELDEKRVSRAIHDYLEEKGFKTEEDSKFKINFYAETHERSQRHNMHIGIGAIGTHVGGNIGSGIPIDSHQKILSLTVEFVDAETNQLFWQGVSEGKIVPSRTPEERSQFIEKMVNKLLKGYPPSR